MWVNLYFCVLGLMIYFLVRVYFEFQFYFFPELEAPLMLVVGVFVFVDHPSVGEGEQRWEAFLRRGEGECTAEIDCDLQNSL